MSGSGAASGAHPWIYVGSWNVTVPTLPWNNSGSGNDAGALIKRVPTHTNSLIVIIKIVLK